MKLDERRTALELQQLEVEIARIKVETRRVKADIILGWYKATLGLVGAAGAAGAALKVFGLM